jgi:tetratricopeptide (TPR) repeat protein
LARIYEEMGNAEEAINMMDRLAKGYPRSRYIEEIQFRRGEHYYVRKKFATAHDAYQAIVLIGARSSYYELALYKLGWSFYKQEQNEAAMRQFVALLDHKIATGYDLDHPRDSFDEKRVEDTYRVMSLGFSNLGGGEAVSGFFKKYGRRPFEASVYKILGITILKSVVITMRQRPFRLLSETIPITRWRRTLVCGRSIVTKRVIFPSWSLNPIRNSSTILD